MWPSVPSLSPTILEDSGNGFLAQTDCDKSDKGTGSDKRLLTVTAMLRQVFCGAQGATLAFVTDLGIQHRCEDNIADALRAYANSQNGDWLSADSISRTFWIRASLKPCSVSDFVATLNFWKHVY